MAERPTILVVEDEALIADVVVWQLEEAGFVVVTAASGDEALALIAGPKTFDVLFTDIRMPGRTDGWLLAEKAREHYPQLPVIYASGYSPHQAREVSGSVFLPKPYRAGMLLDALTRVGIELPSAC
jgi:CheY-like chemotaxis protein